MHTSEVKAVSGGQNMPLIYLWTRTNIFNSAKVVFLMVHSLYSISYPKITDGGIIHPCWVEAVGSRENMSPIYLWTRTNIFFVKKVAVFPHDTLPLKYILPQDL